MLAKRTTMARALVGHALVVVLVIAVTAAGVHWRGDVHERWSLAGIGVVVIVAAVLGGEGPALLATVLGALAFELFLLAPTRAPASTGNVDHGHWALFIVTGTLVSVVASLRRRLQEQSASERDRVAALERERARAVADAERALLAEERRFRAVFAAQLAPLAIARSDGPVLEANDAWLRLVGRTREEIARGAVTWREITPPEWYGVTVDSILSMAKLGRFGPIEKEYVRPNGRRVPVLVCGARMAGEADTDLVCAIDLTDQKRLERALHAHEAHLDSERAARTELERVGRAKDEFVAMLSHELRTPLNAVLGFAALARRPGQSQQQLEKALAVVERNGRLLAQIIADLFDVSRIVSGKLHVERGPIDLPATIDVALESMRAAAEAKGITLRTAVTDVGAVVLGDATRLQQVVLNLLSNAIKFTPRGGRVEIALARRGAAIELVVSDDGQGIEPEFLPFVFDRFRQAEASMTRQHGGLGIGLAIVKHLVELHGGNVHAESEGPGRGARFVVTLPPHSGLASSATGPAATAANLLGARILVVDDEPDAQELVKRLLEEQGARVVTASSATEALDMLSETPIDAVVSDIGMPGMDGYEMIRRVRAGSAAHTVPAVALTAYARPEDRARALDAGYQAHVTKPVEPAEMLATVAHVIEHTAEMRAHMA
ncbi:two-component sensor histidine kinase [Minicystis rosea]|nr:two-component sensor histidine kinase [Minicystis rosea]